MQCIVLSQALTQKLLGMYKQLAIFFIKYKD